jgi:hypothetical protein
MDLIGKEVIVRSDKAGVFLGTLLKKENGEVTLKNARKLWYWTGANAVEQLAVEGTKFPKTCKFTVQVDLIILGDFAQILEVSRKASLNLATVPVWKQ